MNQSNILSDEDQSNFIQDGYLIVQNVFSRDIAQDLTSRVWRRLQEDPFNPSKEFRTKPQLEEVIEDGPVESLQPPKLTNIVNLLIGEKRWWTRKGFGWSIVRLPENSSSMWSPPKKGCHVDGMNFTHHVNSRELGLVGLEMLTDAPMNGGATVVKKGSHMQIARHINNAGDSGISYSELRSFAESLEESEIVQVVGKAGDVILMHPHLVHARAQNTLDKPRIAANREFCLFEPMDIYKSRPGGFSLVEKAIRLALNVEN